MARITMLELGRHGDQVCVHFISRKLLLKSIIVVTRYPHGYQQVWLTVPAFSSERRIERFLQSMLTYLLQGME